MGSWLSYGLGSMNDDLPSFIVLVSINQADQPLYARLWGSGFLPGNHQGVQFRSSGDPVLYVSNPGGINQHTRRQLLDGILLDVALDQRSSDNLALWCDNGPIFNLSSLVGGGGGRRLGGEETNRPTGRGTPDDPDVPQGRAGIEPPQTGTALEEATHA